MVAQLAGDRVDPLGLRAVSRLGEEALDADCPLCQRQDPRRCPCTLVGLNVQVHALLERHHAHLCRQMRTFGNASLMDRSGASSLSSVDSELILSLTWM